MSHQVSRSNVFIRVRPLIQREKDADETVNWYADDHCIQQYQQGTKKLLLSTALYAFDQIFNEAARSENVYEKAVAPIVEKSLQGFNGTVLCYGQTSSGKTHTMYGSEDEPGIIFLTAQDIFRRLGDDSRSYLIRIGLLEVYNEKLTDLLDPQRKHIEIQENNGEVIPKDLKEIDVYSPEDMLDAARRVQKERMIGETRMNKESSRSHTILRMIVRSRSNDDSEKSQLTQALLNFVDLAGSEKADQTGAVGDRFREATYINKSLTTLSIVVNQLSGLPTPSNWNPNLNSTSTIISTAAEFLSAKAPAKQPFISYQDSKLTRILQSSLSGNAYIALICNVTPTSIEETHSTLRFASRAKCIKVDPTKNLGPISASEYKTRLLELEKQLNGSSAEADRLRKQLEAFTKFVQPYMNFQPNSPAPFNAQPERRRTLGSIDEFKIPKGPVRRSLMPTAAANNPLQRSQLDSSFDVNENFLLEEPGPPPAKVAKVALSTVKNATIDDKEWCDRYDALRAENDSTVKKLREVTEHKDDLQQQVVFIGETLKVTKFEKIQLEADLATANKSLATANESLSRLKKREQLLGIREKELEEKSKAHDNLAELLAEVLDADKSNESTEDFNDKFELLKREKDDIQEASMRAEHVSLSTKLEAISKELMTAKQENKELGEKLKGANERVLDATGQFKAMHGQIADLQIELSKVRTLKESSDIQVTELKSQVASIQLELEEVKAQKEVAVNEAESLSSKLLTIQKELDHTRVQYSKADAIKDRDTAFCGLQAQNEKVDKLLLEFESLTKNLEEAEAQILKSSLMNASLNEQLAKLKEELQVSQKEISELESVREAKADIEHELTCLKDQMNFLKYSESDAEKLQASNMELTSEIRRTQELLEAQEEKLTFSTSRVNELEERSERECSEICDLKCKLEQHFVTISNLSGTLNNSQANYAAQIQRLQLQLEGKEAMEIELAESKSLVFHLQRLQPQIDELRKKLADKEDEGNGGFGNKAEKV